VAELQQVVAAVLVVEPTGSLDGPVATKRAGSQRVVALDVVDGPCVL